MIHRCPDCEVVEGAVHQLFCPRLTPEGLEAAKRWENQLSEKDQDYYRGLPRRSEDTNPQQHETTIHYAPKQIEISPHVHRWAKDREVCLDCGRTRAHIEDAGGDNE